MSKKTSIEVYEEKSRDLIHMYVNGDIDVRELLTLHHNMFYEIKAMHKEEVTDAYIECWMNDGGNGFHKVKEAEQYYNETFGGQDESNH